MNWVVFKNEHETFGLEAMPGSFQGGKGRRHHGHMGTVLIPGMGEVKVGYTADCTLEEELPDGAQTDPMAFAKSEFAKRLQMPRAARQTWVRVCYGRPVGIPVLFHSSHTQPVLYGYENVRFAPAGSHVPTLGPPAQADLDAKNKWLKDFEGVELIAKAIGRPDLLVAWQSEDFQKTLPEPTWEEAWGRFTHALELANAVSALNRYAAAMGK